MSLTLARHIICWWRDPGFIVTKAVPSTYHQCIKSIWKANRIYVKAIESPFQRDETHILETAFFYKLAKDGEVAFSRPRGIPLLARDDLEGQEPKSNNFTSTSTQPPRPKNSNSPMTRRDIVEEMVMRESFPARLVNYICFMRLRCQNLLWGLSLINLNVIQVKRLISKMIMPRRGVTRSSEGPRREVGWD